MTMAPLTRLDLGVRKKSILGLGDLRENFVMPEQIEQLDRGCRRRQVLDPEPLIHQLSERTVNSAGSEGCREFEGHRAERS